MNGNRFLLDTNILLYLTGNRIDITALPEGEYFLSFVTELEILSYPSRICGRSYEAAAHGIAPEFCESKNIGS